MYYPDKKEFVKLAEQGNLIPVYREVIADTETPVSAFMKLKDNGYSYLLESVEGGEKMARYSFLGCDPALVFSSKGSHVEIREGRKKRELTAAEGPLKEVKKLLAQYKFVPIAGLPRFCGGLVGYMGYDIVRLFEQIPDENPDDLKLPDIILALTDTLIIFDHIMGRIKVVSNVHIKADAGRAYNEAINKIDKIVDMLAKPLPKPKAKRASRKKLSIKSNLNQKQFGEMVNRAKEYIKNGDIIQVVLSQRFATEFSCQPFDIYRALRSINPSPYMYYLDFDKVKLVGSSPEIMVRAENGKVVVRPIAGTRPRGKDDAEDERLIRDLLNDPKEKAEHIMLVDLGRNDIGRVSQYNSVAVNELMVIEKYSHVIHIVSDVAGDLKKGADQFDVIRATFPAGTVTGAPKVRAMEIIDELEKTKRGPYAGFVGYFSFSGNLDTAITIRTIVIKGNKAYIQAGAGIVADSQPLREYEETVNKAKGMIKAIELAQAGLE